MKKVYVAPTMVCEEFAANEYIAACWTISCNVPSGYGYIDKNGNGKYDKYTDEKLTSDGVYGCGDWHKGVEGVPDDGPVANAMWHSYGSWFEPEEDYPVYYWRDGKGRLDIHFSKVEDAEWKTNPNAS